MTSEQLTNRLRQFDNKLYLVIDIRNHNYRLFLESKRSKWKVVSFIEKLKEFKVTKTIDLVKELGGYETVIYLERLRIKKK